MNIDCLQVRWMFEKSLRTNKKENISLKVVQTTTLFTGAYIHLIYSQMRSTIRIKYFTGNPFDL